jgi:hypothetical protein
MGVNVEGVNIARSNRQADGFAFFHPVEIKPFNKVIIFR